jgi:hypothetical protein
LLSSECTTTRSGGIHLLFVATWLPFCFAMIRGCCHLQRVLLIFVPVTVTRKAKDIIKTIKKCVGSRIKNTQLYAVMVSCLHPTIRCCSAKSIRTSQRNTPCICSVPTSYYQGGVTREGCLSSLHTRSQTNNLSDVQVPRCFRSCLVNGDVYMFLYGIFVTLLI